MFRTEICKISEFLSENFHFWLVQFSVYLNRLVYVMTFRLRKETKILQNDIEQKIIS